MTHCTYLLPIRRKTFARVEAEEFLDYFRTLGAVGCEVLVVDGSPPPVFEQHEKIWSESVRHEPVNARFAFLNDKVNGIHTGVELARSGKIILADDDIRYTAENIGHMCALLDDYEVVRPQNFLSTGTAEVVQTFHAYARKLRSGQLPWWARLETARMLINRATLRTGDYPGTCAFRRATFLRVGAYDGDVLFDNEEIIRHFARAGARIAYEQDLFIAKRPPTFRKWLEQRPRQAYEDFALRVKTALFAGVLPLMITAAVFGRMWGFVAAVATVQLGASALALIGRTRGEAARYFDFHAPLFAGLWVIERSLSTWWAFYWHRRYRGYPFGERLLSKGVGRDWVEGGRIAAAAATQQSPK